MSVAWHRKQDAGVTSSPEPLRARETGENFPVALRVLHREHREHLHAVYAFARLVDETGDSAPGDRRARLLELDAGLDRMAAGETPEDPVLARLDRSVRARGLSREPFHQLIQANLQDQQVHRYETFEQLLGYCELSANPVGHTVLELFGESTPRTRQLSDRVCTALQLLEHCQDVAEDHRAGRVYLPQQDLRCWGVSDHELSAPTAGPRLRGLMLFEVERAADLLEDGASIVAALRGWGRLSVAGFVAGGRATATALRRSGGDVLARPVRPSRLTTVIQLVRLLAGPGGGAR